MQWIYSERRSEVSFVSWPILGGTLAGDMIQFPL